MLLDYLNILKNKIYFIEIHFKEEAYIQFCHVFFQIFVQTMRLVRRYHQNCMAFFRSCRMDG